MSRNSRNNSQPENEIDEVSKFYPFKSAEEHDENLLLELERQLSLANNLEVDKRKEEKYYIQLDNLTIEDMKNKATEIFKNRDRLMLSLHEKYPDLEDFSEDETIDMKQAGILPLRFKNPYEKEMDPIELEDKIYQERINNEILRRVFN